MSKELCLKSILLPPRTGFLRSGQRFRAISLTDINSKPKKVGFTENTLDMKPQSARRLKTIPTAINAVKDVHSKESTQAIRRGRPKQGNTKDVPVAKPIRAKRGRPSKISVVSKSKTKQPEVNLVASPSGDGIKFDFSINKTLLPKTKGKRTLSVVNLGNNTAKKPAVSRNASSCAKPKKVNPKPNIGRQKRVVSRRQSDKSVAGKNVAKRPHRPSPSASNRSSTLSEDNLQKHNKQHPGNTSGISSWMNNLNPEFNGSESSDNSGKQPKRQRRTRRDSEHSDCTAIYIPRKYLEQKVRKMNERNSRDSHVGNRNSEQQLTKASNAMPKNSLHRPAALSRRRQSKNEQIQSSQNLSSSSLESQTVQKPKPKVTSDNANVFEPEDNVAADNVFNNLVQPSTAADPPESSLPDHTCTFEAVNVESMPEDAPVETPPVAQSHRSHRSVKPPPHNAAANQSVRSLLVHQEQDHTATRNVHTEARQKRPPVGERRKHGYTAKELEQRRAKMEEKRARQEQFDCSLM